MSHAPDVSATSSDRIPSLSSTFCYTPFALQTFLRQSRAIVDDPISQQLSAFSQSSTKPFHPLASLPPARIPSTSRLPSETCAGFVSNILIPAWTDRSRVIQYCGDVAAQEDNEDPERGVRESEQQKKRDMVVDERLDPYSGRFQVRESRRERLQRAVREEWEIESITRSRSWGVLKTRCMSLNGNWSDSAPVPTVQDWQRR